MLHDILILLFGILIGAVVGFFLARHFMKKYLKQNPPINEDMIKTYYKINNFKAFKKNEALEVSAIAYYQIPKNTKKSHKLLMIKGEMLPTKKPDIDNIMKVVLDALNGVAYHDDSQIVKIYAVKYFSEYPEVKVTISEI